MRNFIKWIAWLLKKKPLISYSGYNCGCCGKWYNKPFKVPKYISEGEWWDTIGICKNGEGCQK